MLSTDDPSSPQHAGDGVAAEHVRAITVGRTLAALGAGWVKLADSIYALKSFTNMHIYIYNSVSKQWSFVASYDSASFLR